MALLKPTTPTAPVTQETVAQAAQPQTVVQPAVAVVDPNLTVALTPEQIAAARALLAAEAAPVVVEQTPVVIEHAAQPAVGAWVETTQPFVQETSPEVLAPVNPVAVQTQNTAVAETTRSAMTSAPDLAEAGFGGLAIGARSFPIIALKTDGLFEDSDGGAYGKGFRCRPISSKAKTAVQGRKVVNGKADEKVFFTYDGITSTSGRSVAELEKEFTDDGRTLARREYTDVIVTMEAPGEPYDQELRILSIAPTSRERLSGAIMTLAIRNGWNTQAMMENINNYVLSVEVGAKVTKAEQPFYPWSFRFEK